MEEDLELTLLHTDITETRIDKGSYLDNRQYLDLAFI